MSSPNTPNLVLPPSALTAGATYTFKLQITVNVSIPGFNGTTRSVQALGFSQVAIHIVPPPNSGVSTSFSVTPTQGYALTTPFLLQCFGWTTEAPPLSYEFRYVQKSSTQQQLLSGGSLAAASMSALLPAGNLTVIAYIFNINGAFAVGTRCAVWQCNFVRAVNATVNVLPFTQAESSLFWLCIVIPEVQSIQTGKVQDPQLVLELLRYLNDILNANGASQQQATCDGVSYNVASWRQTFRMYTLQTVRCCGSIRCDWHSQLLSYTTSSTQINQFVGLICQALASVTQNYAEVCVFFR